MQPAHDIDRFLARLRTAGFKLSTADVLRIVDLATRISATRADDVHSLKTFIGPLIAQSADEQARFGHLYDEFFTVEPQPGGDPGGPGGGGGGTGPIEKGLRGTRRFQWRLAAAFAFWLLLIVLIVFRQALVWQPPAEKPAEASKTDVPPLSPPPVGAADETSEPAHPALTALMLIVLSLLAIEIVRSTAMTLRHRRRRDAGHPFEWPLTDSGRPPLLFQNDTFLRAARLLRGREAGEGKRLDLRRSISETIRNLDDPVLAYRSQNVLPEYLFLIERRGNRDHLATYFDALASALEEAGVIVERYYFERDPRYCWQLTAAARVHISDLQQRFPARRVVVCGEASSVIDPISGRTAPWVRTHFSWRHRALLVPYLAPAAGARDWFDVYGATSAQLEMLADRWARPDAEVKPSAVEWPVVDDDAAIDELQAILPPTVFRWLLRSAVFPALQWPLTRALAPAELRGEAHEAALLRLVSLPWFRRGTIPPAERDALCRLLARDRDESVAARDVALRLLGRTTAPAGSAAAQMIEIEIVAQSAWRAIDTGEPAKPWLRKLRDYPAAHLDRDSSLMKFLDARAAAGIHLPSSLRGLIFRRGLPVLGVRSFLFTALLIPVLFALAMKFATPQPPPPPPQPDTGGTSATMDTAAASDTMVTDTSSSTATMMPLDTAATATSSTMSMSETTATSGTISTSSSSTTGVKTIVLIGPANGVVVKPGSKVVFRWKSSRPATVNIQRAGGNLTSFKTAGGSYDWTAPREGGDFTWWVYADGPTSELRSFTIAGARRSQPVTRSEVGQFEFKVDAYPVEKQIAKHEFVLNAGERIVNAKLTVLAARLIDANAKVLSIQGNVVQFEYSATNKSPESQAGLVTITIEATIARDAAAAQ